MCEVCPNYTLSIIQSVVLLTFYLEYKAHSITFFLTSAVVRTSGVVRTKGVRTRVEVRTKVGYGPGGYEPGVRTRVVVQTRMEART